MVAQITSALSNGFTSSQIISFLVKQFPSHSKQIKKAISQGFTAEQVIKYLSGGKKSLAEDQPEGNTEYQKTRNMDISRRENVTNTALKGAGAGALAIGGSLAAPMAMQALQRAAPQLVGPSAITNTPGAAQMGLPPNQAQLQSLGTPSANPQQPPVSTTLPQSTQPAQSQGIGINAKEILSKYPGFESKVNDMVRSKNTPEAIAQYFKQFNASQTKKLEKETGQPIEAIISEYLSQSPDLQANVKPALQPEISEEKKPLTREEALGKFRDKIIEKELGPTEVPKPIEPIKIEKGSTVSSPQGVGEIKEIRNGKAIIDVDGKKHQVEEEDLESEPEDVVQTVQELLKIPEVDKSSVVSLFTYDPDESKMYIQFHNGESYKYLDVDPEKVSMIANKMGIPVTQGKNIFGAWSPNDKKSLGATLIKQIISDPKYKKPKKGEPENPNYVKLETLYDYWEKLRKKSKRK